MKLIDLLRALSANKSLNITLIDSTDTELITFNAVGYQSVESDLGDRTVRKITVGASGTVKIVIDDATTP